MRAPLCLLLVAAAAVAEPSVRWIDKVGNIEVRTIREVVRDEGPVTTVRLPSGEILDVETRRTLSLVREREGVPRERELLRARLDVAAGERLDEARPVLDRLIGDDDAPPWMREYAAASRAVLAERAGDKDAENRVELFLAGHPRSRFASALLRARMRLAVRRAADGMALVLSMEATRKSIRKLRGPILDEYLTVMDGAECMWRRFHEEFVIFLDGTGETVHQAEASGDVGAAVVARSVLSWVELFKNEHLAAAVRRRKRPPHGPLEAVRRLLRLSRFDLPESRSDLHLAYGGLLRETGSPDAAAVEFKRALELAPDLRRRLAARAALDKK